MLNSVTCSLIAQFIISWKQKYGNKLVSYFSVYPVLKSTTNTSLFNQAYSKATTVMCILFLKKYLSIYFRGRRTGEGRGRIPSRQSPKEGWNSEPKSGVGRSTH